jgi:hypothetical protein
MTTRYSLPPQAQQSDTARGARTLAAIVLVVTVLSLSLLAAVVPLEEAPIAGATEGTHAPASVTGA